MKCSVTFGDILVLFFRFQFEKSPERNYIVCGGSLFASALLYFPLFFSSEQGIFYFSNNPGWIIFRAFRLRISAFRFSVADSYTLVTLHLRQVTLCGSIVNAAEYGRTELHAHRFKPISRWILLFTTAYLRYCVGEHNQDQLCRKIFQNSDCGRIHRKGTVYFLR